MGHIVKSGCRVQAVGRAGQAKPRADSVARLASLADSLEARKELERCKSWPRIHRTQSVVEAGEGRRGQVVPPQQLQETLIGRIEHKKTERIPESLEAGASTATVGSFAGLVQAVGRVNAGRRRRVATGNRKKRGSKQTGHIVRVGNVDNGIG